MVHKRPHDHYNLTTVAREIFMCCPLYHQTYTHNQDVELGYTYAQEDALTVS